MADKEKKASPKSISKNELFAQIAEASGLTKAQVKIAYDALTDVIVKNLSKKGGGVLVLPGLFKLTLRKTKAVKGGKKAINRFTGEEIITKDKPAQTKVRARTLKNLNDAMS